LRCSEPGVALSLQSKAFVGRVAERGSLNGIIVFAENQSRKSNLASSYPETHGCHMSTKQIVQDLLQKLPEDVSLHDIAREIEFVAGVRQGFAEIDRGERIPIEEIERELPSWVIR
jgi:predicted transcriptional regulator